MKKKARIVADRFSWRLFFGALYFRLKTYQRPQVILADDAALPSFFSLIADSSVCEKDLGDFETVDRLHLFHDREKILSMIDVQMTKSIFYSDNIYLPPVVENNDNLRVFISRYVVSNYAHRVSAALLAINYSLNCEDKIDAVYIENSILPSGDFNNLPCIFYTSCTQVITDMRHIIRLKFVWIKLFFSKNWIKNYSGPKKIAVQYVSGLENIGYGTDFDWLKYSDLDEEDIVYLIPNGQVPCAKLLDDKIKKGMIVFDTKDFKFCPTHSEIKKSLLAMASAFYNSQGNLFSKIRAAAIIAVYAYCALKWKQIFSELGIAGYVTVADTNLDALPQMHALEYLGGVDLSYEFSATGYHAYMDCKPLGRHQYICWGNLTKKMIFDCADKVPYRILPEKILLAGNMKLYLQDSELSMHDEVLKKLLKNNIKRRILIVDSSPTHLKFLSVEKLQNFYDCIFELIESKPDYFFVLKPQRQLSLRSGQLQILEKFQSQERLVLAPDLGLMHYLLPHVDLVIGMPIYASSIMEAAAAKKAVLCFNQLNWPHVMNDYIPKKALVDNSKDLISAVDAALLGEIDFTSFWHSIDPYGDACGHKRFGFYIGSWLKNIRIYGSADIALPHVIEDYNRNCALPESGNL